MITSIMKRDGRVVLYDAGKIASAILKALEAAGEGDAAEAARVANRVERELALECGANTPRIEQIQDLVERQLMECGHDEAAKRYILYRANRTRIREANSQLMKTIDEITNVDARLSDMKRDNANIDGNTAMGSMLQIGTAGAKSYNAAYLLTPEQAKAHREGDIHIHDFDFYSLTTTCTQIDILRLFHGGFSTGHGFLREPKSIGSYAALAAIAIQSNQNDQHGGQSIPNFDYGMAEGVAKTFARAYAAKLAESMEDILNTEDESAAARAAVTEAAQATGHGARLGEGDSETEFDRIVAEALARATRLDSETATRLVADRPGDLPGHGRLCAQPEHHALPRRRPDPLQQHQLRHRHQPRGPHGHPEHPDGRGRRPGLWRDPHLPHPHLQGKGRGQLQRGRSQLRSVPAEHEGQRFPNYVFLDAPFNLQYYKPGHPETEVATMGCRTRVMGNVYDPERQIAYSRGNLSFTSINLPRLAIEAHGDEAKFYEMLDEKLELVAKQLLDRYEIQAAKRVYNYPFLMGQGVWLDSDKLGPTDEVREVLKHGTLSIGFIGLAETLTALYGHHHGESDEMQKKGLEIVGHMRQFCDDKSQAMKMNFTLLATPAEGLSGRFTRMDQKRYGTIPGVTDREYYTNSFHIPVWYPISAYDKIQKEAPYHALTNAGHISYVELDGDTAHNLEAFESVVRCMHDAGVGYGSINHPVDRDPVCGYVGVIGDVCPRCGRRSGEALSPEKLAELRKKFPTVPTFCGCE